MTRLVSILASALLLAAIVTELTSRFWPGDYFALLCTAAIALILNGFFVARIAERGAQSTDSASTDTSANNKRSADAAPNKRRDGNNERGNRGGRNDRTDNRSGKSTERRDNNKRGSQQEGRGGDRGRGEQKERAPKQDDRPKQENQRSESPRPIPTPPPGDVEEGIVKWFNRSKGYGFVVRDNGEEIFVHQRSIVGSSQQRPVLHDDQKVSFIVVAHEKGPQAEHVTPL